ncbi:DNA segregation ATPase FtsK/SpoIIIE, S-DNA-T family [Klenkia soli]|uniref:DNA segregation ATPase FtsK/SpoIIIE, S-DNA-T family n=1 Tax=Klenkia soli TaxID=1052260 RepID=A0A1H0HB13_9ACTN|nr:FtsK/SpoIIIE domain-containing protein [Klenkia soli]SDO16406.1 DNA segregation ATPase FtsK/SpoIIIE, S-DNA-T family [Klenkia soli]
MPDSPPPEVVARRWTLRTESGDVDVEVTGPDGAPLHDVRAALATAGVPVAELWAGSRPLPDRTTLGDPALRHGARLGADRPGPRGGGPGGALELHVCAGPGAGRTLAVAQGVLVVGRGRGPAASPSPRLALPDTEVSREHVEVAVTATGVTVRDLGSANGTRLARTAATGGGEHAVGPDPLPWPLGAVLRIGSSSVRLAAPGGPPAVTEAAPGGRLSARAPVRPVHPAVAEVVVEEPDAPAEPPRRQLAWLAIALPAAAGVTMAWVLAAPQFLLLALLSPMAALGSWAGDRWSGRRGHRRRTADHGVALAEVTTRITAAVADELAVRDRRAPDLAQLAAAARRRSGPLWERGPGDPDLLVLRVGTGPGPTAVLRRPPGSPGTPEPADRLPVTVDLRGRWLDLHGPRGTVLGVLRALVCQTAVLHPPDAVPITVLAAAGELPDWRWTRWLPHVGVLPGAHPTAVGSGPHLVVVDTGHAGELDAAARTWVARMVDAGAAVVSTGGPSRDGQDRAVLDVVGGTGGRARLHRPGRPDQDLDLDLADEEVGGQVAADLAPLTVPRGPAGIPGQVRWRDLVATTPTRWSRSRSHLTALLGTGPAGPVVLDLCADGPHALVAGTTGAGKSELLRTTVLSIAAAHPPDLCSFLLVDYKGGAAFAEAAQLPHTVGVLTDLDGASTARALRSLGAELTRRERLLADHGARDLTDLDPGVLLPRLVIVVDEFATLGDELPGFVPGLVAIAQRGRSLGVHLVLATQRPSGVVSPEIRANCTVRLCLRTTDEAGSRDVLGVPDAAWIPVDRPGRGLLRVGAGAPVPLQVARVGTAAPPTGRAPVTARRWRWPVDPVDDLAAEPTERTDLAAEVADLRARADAEGLPVPPRPWLPVLPDRVEQPLPGADPARAPGLLAWGLVDRPAVQRQDPLLVDLAAGGGWLVVGGPGSGRSTALRTLLAEAVHRLTPADVHVHAVDHAGGALTAAVRGGPLTGTHLQRGDGHRLQRLLGRLQEEVDRRRAGDTPAPHLLLLVDGVDSVWSSLEELAPGTGGAALLRLLREGAAVGLTAVLTADRVLPGGRWAGAAAHRLVLPLADRADYAAAGVPARVVPGHRPPGRALLDDDALEVQLALPRALPVVAAHPVPGRIAVVQLPPDPPAPDVPTLRPGVVALGPGGDDGSPVLLDLVRTGGLLVAGPPGSGRSSTLAALAGRLAAGGTPAAFVVGPRERLGVPLPHGVLAVVPDRVVELPAWAAAAGSPAVVLVDDLGHLPDPVLDALAGLTAPGASTVLVAAATPADVAGTFRGPGPALRRTRTALLLQPARGDAELLSLRIPRADLPARPGSGWLVTAGAVTRVQVAR